MKYDGIFLQPPLLIYVNMAEGLSTLNVIKSTFKTFMSPSNCDHSAKKDLSIIVRKSYIIAWISLIINI